MKTYPTPELFLQNVIKEFYQKEAHSTQGKLNFVILLLASGEMIPTVQSYLSNVSIEKKLLSSAVSVVVLRLLLRRLLGGPLGIVLSAAGIASLTSLAYKNRDTIAARIGDFRKQTELLKLTYEGYLARYQRGEVEEADFELMVEGLKAKFFEALRASSMSHS